MLYVRARGRRGYVYVRARGTRGYVYVRARGRIGYVCARGRKGYERDKRNESLCKRQ